MTGLVERVNIVLYSRSNTVLTHRVVGVETESLFRLASLSLFLSLSLSHFLCGEGKGFSHSTRSAIKPQLDGDIHHELAHVLRR